MSQRRSALILYAGHKNESLCVYIFNRICLFVLNLGDIVAVAIVLLVQKTVLAFTFYIWKLRDYISLLLKITLLRYTYFVRTSHFNAEVESSLNCLALLPLPHVSSPLSPPALPLLHPYPPPSPPLPLSHLFSSFPLRRLFTFFAMFSCSERWTAFKSTDMC